ncbi:MAG: HEAT repeat domain-containing protein, partial [Pseudomonadota bacterium]
MKLIHTTLLALLLAGAAVAQAKEAVRATSEDEELSIAALEGLMAQPSDRALPILKKVLTGSQSTLVKRRALFVLAQIGNPQARDILMQWARSPNVEMRREAIRGIGIDGDPKSLDALQEIYKAGDADVKKEILKAWMIAGRKEAVYQAALNAKSEDEASEAMRMLGVMGAREELRKLGERPGPPRGLLEAFALSGDITSLRKIADGNGEHSVRVEAVRKLGIIQDDAARTALHEIYTRSTDAEIKAAALQGMMIAQDEQGVLMFYRAAKTTEEKRALLRTLSMMG